MNPVYKSAKNRVAWLELARILGLLAVVYGHEHIMPKTSEFLWSLSYNQWMPFFFFLPTF